MRYRKHGAALADQGLRWQASMGVRLKEAEFVDDGEARVINGRTFKGPGLHVTKSLLKESSFVPLGADSSTRAAVLSDTGFIEILLEIDLTCGVQDLRTEESLNHLYDFLTLKLQSLCRDIRPVVCGTYLYFMAYLFQNCLAFYYLQRNAVCPRRVKWIHTCRDVPQVCGRRRTKMDNQYSHQAMR